MVFVDFKNDLYFEGNFCNIICCCGDLRDVDFKLSGCYDIKVCKNVLNVDKMFCILIIFFYVCKFI